MEFTDNDYLRMSEDAKFMAARYKRRVAISEMRLEELLRNGVLSEKERLEEVGMHKARIRKWKEWEEKLKKEKR